MKNSAVRAQAGFTLLEVLLAVAITAMIGVGSAQLLNSIINAKQGVDIRSEKLASLQRFNMAVSRDIEQIINRPIRDIYGDEQAALRINDGDYPLEFTRAGWRNSPVAEDPRSELQRVAYRMEPIDSEACEVAYARLQSWGVNQPEGECLVRYFWPVLDQASVSEPLTQVVLEQIDGFEIELLVSEESADSESEGVTQETGRNWYTDWSAINAGLGGVETPLVIRWRLELPELGSIERQWFIPWGDF